MKAIKSVESSASDFPYFKSSNSKVYFLLIKLKFSILWSNFGPFDSFNNSSSSAVSYPF
jgi:hypothetical protein